MDSIVLGGGCFWCIEGAFKGIIGVESALPGYAGGHGSPDYESVCSGETGHAEVVNVVFDQARISLEQVLKLFFLFHDPTQLNRQGNDVGTQYRSVIFPRQEQLEIVNSVIDSISTEFEDDVVTTVEELTEFHLAEEYHHDYFTRNPQNTYCQMVVAPKLAKLRKELAELYR